MIYSLEKLYKYLGIDPWIKCKNYNNCKLQLKNRKECLGGCFPLCEHEVPLKYYPKIDEIPLPRFCLLLDLVCEACVLTIRKTPKDGGFHYILTADTLRVENEEKEIALLQLIELMLEAGKFNEGQKNDLFYIISYLEIYKISYLEAIYENN